MRKKNKRGLLIALGALIVLCAVLSVVIKDNSITSKKLTAALTPLLREEEPAPGGTLPDDPKFVLYDLDNKIIYIPNAKTFPRGTNDPEQVNVVVAYHQVFSQGRFYMLKGRKDVYSRDLVVSVIQLDGWKLIRKETFEENGGALEKTPLPWKNKLSSEANAFINSTLSGNLGVSTAAIPVPEAADAP